MNVSSKSNPRDNAGVRIPPPVIALGFLLAGLWYDSPWFQGELAGLGVTILGGVIALSGFSLILHVAPRHKKAGSNIEPWKPTTAIITDGVYGYSRNPIYLGMVITHGGVAIGGGSMGALVTMVMSLLTLQTYVIAREERYLEEKFGDVYTNYKKQVRRWI